MKRIRTIKGCINEILAEQPAFPITEYSLRRLCVSGKFPCQRLNRKYLVDMDLLDSFLSTGLEGKGNTIETGIRRVETRR